MIDRPECTEVADDIFQINPGTHRATSPCALLAGGTGPVPCRLSPQAAQLSVAADSQASRGTGGRSSPLTHVMTKSPPERCAGGL